MSSLEFPTDQQLVTRVRRGDAAATEQLVRRWTPRVVAVCHARTQRFDMAEDLAQETMLRGLASLNSLKEEAKLGPWLRGIATRVCIDWLRAKGRRPETLTDMAEFDCIDPVEEAVDGHDEQAHLIREVESLPDDLREPLLLHYYDNVTYEQIAELLGVSRATVSARLTKARTRLAHRLAHLAR